MADAVAAMTEMQLGVGRAFGALLEQWGQPERFNLRSFAGAAERDAFTASIDALLPATHEWVRAAQLLADRAAAIDRQLDCGVSAAEVRNTHDAAGDSHDAVLMPTALLRSQRRALEEERATNALRQACLQRRCEARCDDLRRRVTAAAPTPIDPAIAEEKAAYDSYALRVRHAKSTATLQAFMDHTVKGNAARHSIYVRYGSY
jgi:hypothetical protein